MRSVAILLALAGTVHGQMVCENGVCRLPNQPLRNVARVVVQPAANAVQYVRQVQPIRSLVIPAARTQMISIPAASPDCTCESCVCGLASVVPDSPMQTVFMAPTVYQEAFPQDMAVQTMVYRSQAVSSNPGSFQMGPARGPLRGFLARRPLRSLFCRMFRL